MNINHLNHVYDGGTPDVPLGTGDNYYAQDLGRDFHYAMDRIGLLLKDLSQSVPMRAKGLEVTHNVGTDTLNVAVGSGYVEHDIEIPGDFGAGFPPASAAATIEAIRVEVRAAIASFDYSATATLNGSTVNYVKLAYAEQTVYSRARRWKAGNYAYEVRPWYTLTVDAVAPTSKQLVLATFTSSASGSGFAFGAQSTKTPFLYNRGESPIGTIIAVDKRVNVDPDVNFWSPCDGVAALPAEWFDVSTYPNVPDLNDDVFLSGTSGGYATGGANSLTTASSLGVVALNHTHNYGTLAACINFLDVSGLDRVVYREVSSIDPWTTTDYSNAPGKTPLTVAGATTGVDIVGNTGSASPSNDFAHTHTIADSRPKYFAVNYYIRIA